MSKLNSRRRNDFLIRLFRHLCEKTKNYTQCIWSNERYFRNTQPSLISPRTFSTNRTSSPSKYLVMCVYVIFIFRFLTDLQNTERKYGVRITLKNVAVDMEPNVNSFVCCLLPSSGSSYLPAFHCVSESVPFFNSLNDSK